MEENGSLFDSIVIWNDTWFNNFPVFFNLYID